MRCRDVRVAEVRRALAREYGATYAELTDDQCATIAGRWARARKSRTSQVEVHEVCANFLELWLETKRRADAREAELAKIAPAAQTDARVEVVAP